MPMSDDDSNLSERTYRQLKADIISARIAPGARVNIAEICTRLAVSPAAVREALSRLMSERLVVSEHNRGFRATAISVDALRELSRARAELDALCLREALKREDIDWEANLISASHRARRRRLLARRSDRDADAFVDAHAAFHDAVAAGCGNEWLIWTRRILSTQSERYRHLCIPMIDQKDELYAEGHPFIPAVLARDGEKAVALLTAHYEAMVEKIIAATEESARPESDAPREAQSSGEAPVPRSRRKRVSAAA